MFIKLWYMYDIKMFCVSFEETKCKRRLVAEIVVVSLPIVLCSGSMTSLCLAMRSTQDWTTIKTTWFFPRWVKPCGTDQLCVWQTFFLHCVQTILQSNCFVEIIISNLSGIKTGPLWKVLEGNRSGDPSWPENEEHLQTVLFACLFWLFCV